MNSSHRVMKAVLLVGGAGTRLRPVVASGPKPLARVGDRPFLELVVRQLSNQGIRHLVFCTGYLAQEIEKEFGDGRTWEVTIEYSKEATPLGTAGALKLAEPLLRDEGDFLMMNGDSFLEIDFRQLIVSHRRCGGIGSMAVVQVKNDKRYGTVRCTSDGRIYGFTEKGSDTSSGFVNAGNYVFNRRIFEHLPDGPASLETDVFPRILGHGLYASMQQGVFIDIGTPEDYQRAQLLFERLYEAAYRKPRPDAN